MLPTDINILLSYVNMKLRDEYADPGDLCAALDEDEEALIRRLAENGWRYDKAVNQFVRNRPAAQ